MRAVDSDNEKKFSPFTFQICSKGNVRDLIDDILTSNAVKTKLGIGNDASRIRFWKLDPMTRLEAAFEKFKDTVSSAKSYDYQIPFPGVFLKPDVNTKIEDLEITDKDYIFLEVREDKKAFNLIGDDVPLVVRCDNCGSYAEIVTSCVCTKVS